MGSGRDVGREGGVEKMNRRGIGHTLSLSGSKKMWESSTGQMDIRKGLSYCDGILPYTVITETGEPQQQVCWADYNGNGSRGGLEKIHRG